MLGLGSSNSNFCKKTLLLGFSRQGVVFSCCNKKKHTEKYFCSLILYVIESKEFYVLDKVQFFPPKIAQNDLLDPINSA